MEKEYSIYLDSKKIGMTRLEKADTPMGVAFGLIEFKEIESPYLFFIDYCTKNKITINTIDPEFEFIDTQVIPQLKVFRQDGLELIGEAGNYIIGMKEEGYEISVLGISSSFYEEEFPHHVKAYKQMFKK